MTSRCSSITLGSAESQIMAAQYILLIYISELTMSHCLCQCALECVERDENETKEASKLVRQHSALIFSRRENIVCQM